MSVKVSVGGGTQILPNARDVQKRIDAARPSLVLTNAGDNHWNYQSQGIIVTSNVSMWGTDFSRYPDNKPIQFSQSDSLCAIIIW